MWPEFIHHLTLHFAIVLPMALAAVGLWSLKAGDGRYTALLRWGGLVTLALTVLTAVTGLLAGGFAGGEDHLIHHRYLGIMTTIVVAIAAVSYDYGVRRDSADWRSYGVGVWCVATFSTIGAGHWGVLAEHGDIIPL